MKICFYGNHKYWGGLAQNGGSRTILLSAKTLEIIGHDVDIVTHTDRFTWFAHKAVRSHVPKKTDLLIAISISDVKDLIKNYRKYKLAYWARPFEMTTKYQKWQMSQKKVLKVLSKFRAIGGKIICNSGWQVEWLGKHGIKSTLVFSGQDLGNIDYPPDYQSEFKMTICCQYSTKKRKGWKDFKKLAKLCGNRYEYVAFGSEKCKDKFLSKYLCNPKREALNELYRQSDIFFIPSKYEGFYNCGVEAAMQGCLLVGSYYKSNGIGDYVGFHTGHIYDTLEEARQILLKPDFKRVAKCQALIRKRIGTRKQNMKKLVECLQ